MDFLLSSDRDRMKKHMLITARIAMAEIKTLVTEFILNGGLFKCAEKHTHTHSVRKTFYNM